MTLDENTIGTSRECMENEERDRRTRGKEGKVMMGMEIKKGSD